MESVALHEATTEMNVVNEHGPPISVRFAQPWIEDNLEFIEKDLVGRKKTIGKLKELRYHLLENDSRAIQKHTDGCAYELAAVDASVVDVSVGATSDIATVLVQAALHESGNTTFDKPCRYGPFDTETISKIRPVARLYRELIMLECVSGVTIADNSMWSFLMEANMAITNFHAHMSHVDAYGEIVRDISAGGLFRRFLENKNIVAMPKLGVSQSFYKRYPDFFYGVVSDREVCSVILEEGEYLYPKSLMEKANFGDPTRSVVNVEMRGWVKDYEQIKHVYMNDLYFTYYRPWGSKRCYRIEGRKELITDRDFLASVKQATKYREIAEPLPQFMVDYATKQISAVSRLYGELNQFRLPFLGFHRTSR